MMDVSELTELFDQTQDIIALVDTDLRYVAANKAYCRYWGVSRDTLTGRTMESVIGPTFSVDTLQDKLRQCLKGKGCTYELWIDFPGMGRRHMDVRYSPRFDKRGTVTGLFFISRDTTERKQLQQELQDERDKFDTILSSLNAGLVLFQDDLTIEWHNTHLQTMLPDSAVCGSTCSDFLNTVAKSSPPCCVETAFNTGAAQTRELRSHDGRWFTFTALPIAGKNGKVTQVLGHITDNTDWKKSLLALQAREAELASIFRATRVGIGILRDGVFTRGNDYFFTMIGYPPEEILGHSMRMVHPTEEEFLAVDVSIQTQILAGTTVGVETRWVRKNGTILDVLITVTPMHPRAPQAGLTFVAMDITQNKQAEEAIRASEGRFMRIFETVDAIAVQGYDREHRVVYWNSASERLYGFSQSEAMGQRLEELIIPEPMRQAVHEGIEAWVHAGIAIPPGEIELMHRDGSSVPVYSSHVLEQSPTGDVVMYCVDVDMTESRRIHDQLLAAKEEAEAANLAKSEFLANMSHEIRTPLNGIQGMLNLLQGTDLDDRQREYAQAGMESANRLNRLLSDILDLSRVEAGKLVIEPTPFNLPRLIADMEQVFNPVPRDSDVTLTCHIGADVPTCATGDGARLQQVLTNLVGNGLKYTDTGSVTLEVNLLSPLRDGEHRVYFTITDTGIGIDDATMQAIFTPFTQGSSGNTRHYQGAGLGLSICKRLVSLMGGNMAVESVPNKGTTTHLVFFLGHASHCETALPLDAVASPKEKQHMRILLAEDDRINAIFGKRLLEQAGCIVSTATNGRQVLAKLREAPFDGIFMDVQMPLMDGIEATTAIRNGEAGEECRNIPIIALTAYAMMGDRESLLAAGMDGYVPKPVDVKDINKALQRIADAEKNN